MSAKMYFGTILCLFSGICVLAQERPVTVADCVTVRYPVVDQPGDGIVLSKDGNEVAYLIKTPVLATNGNQIQLFIKSIYESTQPVLISAGQEIADSPNPKPASIRLPLNQAEAGLRISIDRGPAQSPIPFRVGVIPRRNH
jgi:hypothetical protein